VRRAQGVQDRRDIDRRLQQRTAALPAASTIPPATGGTRPHAPQ
jgi:hypothetical protein